MLGFELLFPADYDGRAKALVERPPQQNWFPVLVTQIRKL